MPTITPCLWFDHGAAEEAATFYTTLFPDSRITNVDRSAADNPSTRKGDVLTVEFTISGRPFIALNGGPEFPFTEAISLSIDCQDQAEVDHYWDALIADGGQPSVCGWLKDRWGVSWQVVPRQLNEYLRSGDAEASERTMKAMLEMKRLDIAKLREAYEGVPA